jgi:hypothetical protein
MAQSYVHAATLCPLYDEQFFSPTITRFSSSFTNTSQLLFKDMCYVAPDNWIPMKVELGRMRKKSRGIF